MKTLVGRVLVRWETLLVVAIIAVGIWSVTLSPFFLNRANLLDLVTPYVFVGLMAFGLTFVVITGEIDISICSTLAASIVCFAQIFAAGVNVWVAALIGLCIAGGLGLVNGLLVGVLNLPSLAVTLGTLAAYSGLAFIVLSGEGVATFPESFTKYGGGYLASNELPIALLVLLAFALGLGILLHGTRFGRYLYAIGSNREAAGLSGIPVTRVRVTVFVISGLMAGVAGLVYVGYFGSARADAASISLLDVVTAVVLGGVGIFGGTGSMPGVLLALILVAEVRNGMQLANLSGQLQNIVIGVLLLAAIVVGNLISAARTGSRPAKLRRRRKGVTANARAEAQVLVDSNP
jgi:rhamnose transport system permease protein